MKKHKPIQSLEELKELQNNLLEFVKYGRYFFKTKQFDGIDRKTKQLVYEAENLPEILSHPDFISFDEYEKDYTLARWFNFQSSRGTEAAFCFGLGAVKNEDQYDKLTDFYLYGEPFDLKTSVFPRALKNDTSWMDNPIDFALWMYENQSQSSSRKSYYNRIFLVCHSSDGEHWKLKADVYEVFELLKNNQQLFKDTMFNLDVGERVVKSNLVCYCR